MLSLTVNAPNPLSLSSNSASTFFNPLTIHRQSTLKPLPAKPISAAIIPSSSNPPAQQQLYQPFRPPPSPLPPKFRSLDTNGRIEVLSNRLGLWFEYAPLIPALIQEGFTPSTVEELTGISGLEQNQLVVGAQVRELSIGFRPAIGGSGGWTATWDGLKQAANQRSRATELGLKHGLNPALGGAVLTGSLR